MMSHFLSETDLSRCLIVYLFDNAHCLLTLYPCISHANNCLFIVLLLALQIIYCNFIADAPRSQALPSNNTHQLGFFRDSPI